MVTVLNAVSVSQWMLFAASLVLFQGLGFGLLAFYSPSREWTWTQRGSVVLALSLALWALLMPWLSLAGIHLTRFTTALIPLAGWLIAAWQASRQADLPTLGRRIKSAWAGNSRRTLLMDGVLWVVIGISALVSLAALEGLAVGPGIDSYHHTLIAQLFVDHGGLPPNYAPYAPLMTFSYHFGFHSVVGALSTLSGIRVISLVPIVGQLMQAGVALTTAFWAGTFFKSRGAAVVAAVVCGLVCALPAAMGSWARYTQLTGLVLMSILLALFWQWLEQHTPRRGIVVLAVLIAGLALSHYRVTLMAGLGMLVFYIAWKIRQREVLPTGLEVRRVLGLAILIVLLYGPWLYRTLASRQVGFGFAAADEFASLDSNLSSFFDLTRLGVWTLNHPTNNLLMGLAGLALIVAVVRRNIQVVALAVWSAVLMALSSERALGQYMDTISVVISLYIPGSLLIGWLVVQAWRASSRLEVRLASTLPKVFSVGLILFVAVQGAWANRGALQQDNVWVHKEDLDVADWIEKNTLPDALILGNTFRSSYNLHWILGQDAAYWFPLLVHRPTLTLPIIYTIERSPVADLENPLMQIFEVSGNLSTPQAVQALQAAGVQYVYIGTRGGPIQRQTLDASPHFKLEFAAGPAAVYRFVGMAPS